MADAFSVGIEQFLTVGVILLALGLYVVMTRTNAVALLMGVELILNAANIFFASFQRFLLPPGQVAGQAMAIFVILLAASEAAVAFAIVIALYRNLKPVDVTQATALRE